MKRATSNQCKDAGLAIILILLLISRFNGHPAYMNAAVVVLLITMTVPKVLAPLARAWFFAADLLSEAGSRVILSVIFYLIVTPVALIRRLSGKDQMGLKGWKQQHDTAFKERNHTYTKEDLEKPF